MKQFDQVFEEVLFTLKEQEQRPTDDLEFNIRTMVLKLQDPINGYIGKDRSANEIVQSILLNRNVLDIGADKLNYLPKVRLQFGQSSNVDDFNVEATVLASSSNAISEKSKKFVGNQSPESICDEVVAYLDKVKMEASTGDAAVKSAPETNAPVQPGAEKSELPTGANPELANAPSQKPPVA
jgi:hypothetical protein